MDRKKEISAPAVGLRIREIRGRRTLKQFAKLLGVKNPTVYRYETDRVPDGDMLIKIAALDPMKRGVEWLLTGEPGALYKEGQAMEPPEPYLTDPRRRKLIEGTKKFAEDADDDLVEALLKNLKAFQELVSRRKQLNKKLSGQK